MKIIHGLPGSVKRKLAADEGPRVVNGISSGPMIQAGSKRPCLEDVTLAMGPGLQPSPFSSGSGTGSHTPHLEGNGLSNSAMGSPYSMPPKASPGSASGGSGAMLPSFNPSRNNLAPTVEQELQDILDELTKNPDPSITELDIDKILGSKGDEEAGSAGGFMHPEGSSTPKRSPPSHLETHLTRSPGFSQAPSVASPHVGPPAAGAPYSLPHPAKAGPPPLSASPLSSSNQSHNQSQARSPMLSAALSSRPGSNWHEVSRAQQLQQMATTNKLLSSSVGPPPTQSVPAPSAPIATAPWAGPSAPYRPGEKLLSSSPHQQPFSPAGSTQSPQSSLISSMVPAPSKGPSPPYHPEKLASPALAQPPFSPQSSLLPSMAPSGGSSTAQSSQTTILPSMPPSSVTTRPSPPYRPDKHSSSAIPQVPPQHQQPPSRSFSSQNDSGTITSQLYKAMTLSQPGGMKHLTQQHHGQPTMASKPQPPKAGAGQDPYSFNNTKPLRHFDPVLPGQKPSPLPQGPLGHYPTPNMQQAPPTASTGHSQILQQQQQDVQQQRMARSMQAGGMVPISRVDHHPGMVSRHQDPSSVPCPTQGNSYNLLLKNQLMRKHLLQEKQRRMEQMNGAQISECHQGPPFQGAGRSLPPECGYSLGTPSVNPCHAAMLSQGPMRPSQMGMPQGSHSQAGRGLGGFMGSSGPKQALYHPSQASQFGTPLRPGQGMMGMGGPTRQPAHHNQASAPAGMAGPSFPGGSMKQPQHLRHALHQGSALQRMVFNPQQQPQLQAWQQQQGLPRIACDSHVDPGLQQQPFPGGGGGSGGGPPQFSQQPMRPGMPGSLASHQNGPPPPNPVAAHIPGRHVQKISTGHPLPSMVQTGLRSRGPLSALSVMKPVPPGMVHPSQGMAPPSYPSSTTRHATGPGYGGCSPGHKLTPYDFAHHQNNGMMPEGQGGGGSGEVDFIDTLVSSNEDWLNNLTMIDEYLEQNS